jgi:hypothetical protein
MMQNPAAEVVALLMYGGEPCRICGEAITRDDLREAVFAGYSEGSESRSAHGPCWREGKPKAEWAFPVDET